jgi:hypothetical protein
MAFRLSNVLGLLGLWGSSMMSTGYREPAPQKPLWPQKFVILPTFKEQWAVCLRSGEPRDLGLFNPPFWGKTPNALAQHTDIIERPQKPRKPQAKIKT